ncbi:MAG: hypothetical protein ACR2JY_04660 [Chloroflexota bacterium]
MGVEVGAGGVLVELATAVGDGPAAAVASGGAAVPTGEALAVAETTGEVMSVGTDETFVASVEADDKDAASVALVDTDAEDAPHAARNAAGRQSQIKAMRARERPGPAVDMPTVMGRTPVISW